MADPVLVNVDTIQFHVNDEREKRRKCGLHVTRQRTFEQRKKNTHDSE